MVTIVQKMFSESLVQWLPEPINGALIAHPAIGTIVANEILVLLSICDGWASGLWEHEGLLQCCGHFRYDGFS